MAILVIVVIGYLTFRHVRPRM